MRTQLPTTTANDSSPSSARDVVLTKVIESLKVGEVDIGRLPQDIKNFYQAWHSPVFYDQSGRQIIRDNYPNATTYKAAFKQAFEARIDRDFETVTNYFSSKISKDNPSERLIDVEQSTEDDQSSSFNIDGIKPNGFLSQNLKRFTDNPQNLLSFLHDYSTYIALLVHNIEATSDEQEKQSQIAKAQRFLQQFPPVAEAEYQCLGGTSSRLSNALSELQRSDIILMAHEKLIRKAVSDFSDTVHEENEVHIKPMLLYFLGIDQKTISRIDHNYRTPLDQLTAQEIWQFVSSYQTKLNQGIIKIVDEAKNQFAEKTGQKEEKERESQFTVKKGFTEEYTNLTSKKRKSPERTIPNSRQYEDLAKTLTENYGIRIEGQDLLDEYYQWKTPTDFESLINQKLKEHLTEFRRIDSMEVEDTAQEESGSASGSVATAISDIDKTDYFSTYLPSEKDITDPKKVKIIADLAKDPDPNKRRVAFNALFVLGEKLESKNDDEDESDDEDETTEYNSENILQFLSILQEIGIQTANQEQIFQKEISNEMKEIGIELANKLELELGYEAVLGITKNQSGDKITIEGENSQFQYLLSRIVDRCDYILRDSCYSIGITSDQEQQEKKELLIFDSAIACGDIDKIRELCSDPTKKDRLINEEREISEDAIHIAAKYNNQDAVRFFLEDIQDLYSLITTSNKYDLYNLAIRDDKIDILNAFLEKLTTDQTIKLITKKGDDDYIPLLLVASNSRVKVLEGLFEKLKELDSEQFFNVINTKDDRGYTALCYAPQYNKSDILKVLLEKCKTSLNDQQFLRVITADFNTQMNPLFCAIFTGKSEEVKTLLELVPNEFLTKMFCEEQNQILHTCARNGYSEITKNLLEKLNTLLTPEQFFNVINKKDSLGHTPLHLATFNHFSHVVTTLLNITPTDKLTEVINAKNNEDKTALNIATEREEGRNRDSTIKALENAQKRIEEASSGVGSSPGSVSANQVAGQRINSATP